MLLVTLMEIRDSVMSIFKKLFRQRHKWEFDSLTEAMLLGGINLTEYDLWHYKLYQQCKLCGERMYLSRLPRQKMSKYCDIQPTPTKQEKKDE